MKDIDETLQWLWDEPIQNHPWDVEVYFRTSKWAQHTGESTDDHSQGFTVQDTVEITEHLENKSLKAITLEVDDFRKGYFGTIKASKMSQNFFEETSNTLRQLTGKTAEAVGSILKQILTEYGTSTNWYKYDPGAGAALQDVHLWELIIKIGDAENDRWISFDYIYGWRFAPEGDTLPTAPRWDGVYRETPQGFEFDAYSLLHWAGFVDSTYLGDLSNKSGVYYDDSEDEVENLEYTDVMNHVVYQLLVDIFTQLGIKEEYIAIEMPAPDDGGSTHDWSTLSTFPGLIDSPSYADEHVEIPNCFWWKSVGGVDTFDYHIWPDAKHAWRSSSIGFVKVTLEKRGVGVIESAWVNITTGSGLSGQHQVKRIWHPGGNSNTFYSLVLDDSGDYWVGTHNLSGTYPVSSIASTNTYQQLDFSGLPNGGGDMHWLGCDIDTIASPVQLWAIVQDISPNDTTYLGYFDISDGSWTTVETVDSGSYTFDTRQSVQTSGTAGAWDARYCLGGFRILENNGVGVIESAWVNITTGSGLSGTHQVKRVWHPGGNSNTFYSLVLDDSGDYWVGTHNLTGTYPVSSIASTNTYQQLDFSGLPNGGGDMHWLGCDIDTVASPVQLWAIVQDVSPNDTTYLGYFDISDGSWTTVETIDSGSYTFDTRQSVQTSGTAGSWDARYCLGGFRVLEDNGGGNYAAAWTTYAYVTTGGLNKWLLFVYLYDSASSPTIFKVDYDFTDGTPPDSPVADDEEARYPVRGGRGSIGGFYDISAGRFVFILPSVETEGLATPPDGHYAVWKSWLPRFLSSVQTDTEVDGSYKMYRSFSSHGTACNNEYATGLVGLARLTAGNDNYTRIKLANFAWVTGSSYLYTTTDDFYIADATETRPKRKWPTISAPSVTTDSHAGAGGPSVPEDRVFVIFKQWGSDAEGTLKNASFLTTYSTALWPNFAKNFVTDGGSLKDELEDIAFAYNLLIFLNLYNTIVRPRYEGAEADAVRTIAVDNYEYNIQKTERLSGYDRIDLEVGGTTYKHPTTVESKNVLSISSDFVLPNRAATRAEQLYDEHYEDRIKYIIKAFHAPEVEPLDVVLFESIVTPGHDVNDGDDAVLCFVQRITIDGEECLIELVTLASGQGMP